MPVSSLIARCSAQTLILYQHCNCKSPMMPWFTLLFDAKIGEATLFIEKKQILLKNFLCLAYRYRQSDHLADRVGFWLIEIDSNRTKPNQTKPRTCLLKHESLLHSCLVPALKKLCSGSSGHCIATLGPRASGLG